MKNLLLLTFLFLSLSLFSQERSDFNSLKIKAQDETETLNLRSDLDTIYPSSSELECFHLDSLAVFTLSQTDWIFGCNSYGDTEGAQVFDIDTMRVNINSVLCWIQKMGTAGNLYARIYEVNETTNTPTNMIAESNAFPNSSLPINPTILQKAQIEFETPVTVTGKFAVSVEWICDFPNSSATGLASTRNGCTADSQKLSWIKTSDGSWMSSQSYTDQSTNSALLTDLYYLLLVEYVNTQIDLPEADNTVKIYPNPARDIIKVETTVEFQEYYIADLSGRKVTECKPVSSSIDISKLESGSYLLVLINNSGKLTKKFIVE